MKPLILTYLVIGSFAAAMTRTVDIQTLQPALSITDQQQVQLVTPLKVDVAHPSQHIVLGESR